MKKRGQLVLKAAIGLVVAVLVGALIVNLSVALFGGEYFSKLIASREGALQLNTLLAIYGNSYIIEEGDITNFRTKFNEKEVRVYSSKEEREIDKAIYSYVTNKDSELDTGFEKPEKIIFSYTGGRLEVGEDIKPNLNKLRCYKEKEIRDIRSLNVYIKLTGEDKKIFEKIKGYVIARKEFKESRERDAYLIIAISFSDKGNDVVKAYVPLENNEESKGLACSILNKISDNSDLFLKGTVIVPVDTTLEEDKHILNSDKVVVLLEIDIDYLDEDKLRMIGESIAEGINRYYKNE